MKNELVASILYGLERHIVEVQKKLRTDPCSFTIAVYLVSKDIVYIWTKFPWMASRTWKSFTKSFPLENRETKLSRLLLAPLKGKHLLLSAVGINMPIYVYAAQAAIALGLLWRLCISHTLCTSGLARSNHFPYFAFQHRHKIFIDVGKDVSGGNVFIPSAMGSCSAKLFVSGSLADSFPCVLQEHPGKLTRYLG